MSTITRMVSGCPAMIRSKPGEIVTRVYARVEGEEGRGFAYAAHKYPAKEFGVTGTAKAQARARGLYPRTGALTYTGLQVIGGKKVMTAAGIAWAYSGGAPAGGITETLVGSPVMYASMEGITGEGTPIETVVTEAPYAEFEAEAEIESPGFSEGKAVVGAVGKNVECEVGLKGKKENRKGVPKMNQR